MYIIYIVLSKITLQAGVDRDLKRGLPAHPILSSLSQSVVFILTWTLCRIT